MQSVRGLGLFLITGVLVLFFQNCGSSFKGLAQVNGSGFDSNPNLPGGSPLLDGDISKSYIFMGSQGVIFRGYMDHIDDSFHRLPDWPVANNGLVNWMKFDQQSQKVFSVSAASPNSQVSVYNIASGGNLALDQNFDVAPGVVHLSVTPLGNGYFLGGTSSYDQNIFSAYNFDLNNSVSDNLVEVDFTPRNVIPYRTHSSTVDTSKNLIYVANSDIGEITVFQWDGVDAIVEIGSIGNLVNPRIVYYSKKMDLLYLVTENRTGESQVKIFQATSLANGDLDQIVEVGSYQLRGDNGADIKLDYANGYILATVREVGASGVHFIPIDEKGLIDTSGLKQPLFVPSLEHPRSVSLSSDGKYVFLTYNVDNQMDLTVLKVSYGEGKEILGTEKIGDYEMGGVSGSPSNMVIDQLIDSSFR